MRLRTRSALATVVAGLSLALTAPALAAVTGDGHADLVATKPDGTLWLYANTGSATTPYSTGTQIGSGWQNFA